MIEAERNGMLVVYEQGRVRNRRLLEETGEGLANERVPAIGSHQAVDLHGIDRTRNGIFDGCLMRRSCPGVASRAIAFFCAKTHGVGAACNRRRLTRRALAPESMASFL